MYDDGNTKRKWRIVSNGNLGDTKIYSPSGEDVTGFCSDVYWWHDSHDVPRVKLMLAATCIEIETIGELQEIVIRNPFDNDRQIRLPLPKDAETKIVDTTNLATKEYREFKKLEVGHD